MSVLVSNSILIARPCAEVFRYVADPDNVHHWYVNIRSVEWLDPKPVQKGTRVAFAARFLGRDLSYTYEIIRYEPPAMLVMRTAEGPFPMETRYICEASGEGQTRMTLENEGTPGGFFSLMTPMMKMAMNKANRKDLLLLKSILESA